MQKTCSSVVPRQGTRAGLAVRGTVPAQYRGSIFNVPIQIVYYDGYPVRPPVVQVMPTADMVIKANEFVRGDGVVSSDLLKRWSPQCNSKLLIEDLTAAFSFKMPVFARTSEGNKPSSETNRPQKSSPYANLAAPLREEFETKASELVSELTVLAQDRVALMKSADSVKQVKSTLREEQSQANSRLSALEQAKNATFLWVSANSAEEAATLSLNQLLPAENLVSASLLQSLACEQAYEETANALVEGFSLRRCSTELFIRSLKGLYRDLFLELQRKAKAVQLLTGSS